MRPYLIQRAKFNYDPYRNGIDSILSFDYMGSAEFEYGALPESLKRIREQISDYHLFEYTINNKKINIFCKKEKENEFDVCVKINGLANNEFHLKEYCDFQHYIYFVPHHCLKNNFWWDIKNDYMFWKFNPEFTDKFEKLIKGERLNG